VLGYFRSCTGRELGLDASDEELIQSYFSASRQVCLCVAPVSARECVASLFSCGNGGAPEQIEPVFLFDAMAAKPAPPARPAEPPPAEAPAPEPPVVAAPRFHQPPPAREQRAWPWLFVLLLAVGCAFLYERWQSARNEWPAPLGLDIRQTQDGVEVSWDTSSRAVRKAGRGTLSIIQDGSRKEFELDADTVHGGSLPYKASGKDTLFRLTVYGPEMQTVTESFRMVAMAQPPPPAAADEPQPQAQMETEAPAAEPSAPRPQSVAAAVPPVAVHEVQPGISEGIRARIQQPVVVPVDVEINASGTVASAVPQGGGDALYRYLAERAAGAARAWRFQPARSKNGTPVPSNKTLYFVFRG
jgi:hypothetical protein